jgi:hypothetical protein
VTIGFGPGVREFSGVLTVERAQLNDLTGEVAAFDAPRALYPVEYRGLDVESTSVVFLAPELRGVYRIAFRDEPNAAPSGFDELIVQQPPS